MLANAESTRFSDFFLKEWTANGRQTQSEELRQHQEIGFGMTDGNSSIDGMDSFTDKCSEAGASNQNCEYYLPKLLVSYLRKFVFRCAN